MVIFGSIDRPIHAPVNAPAVAAMTSGQGRYTLALSHYQAVPPAVQQQLVGQYQAKEEDLSAPAAAVSAEVEVIEKGKIEEEGEEGAAPAKGAAAKAAPAKAAPAAKPAAKK